MASSEDPPTEWAYTISRARVPLSYVGSQIGDKKEMPRIKITVVAES